MPASLFAIGHRVVHGGERFREPVNGWITEPSMRSGR